MGINDNEDPDSYVSTYEAIDNINHDREDRRDAIQRRKREVMDHDSYTATFGTKDHDEDEEEEIKPRSDDVLNEIISDAYNVE